MSWLCGFLKLSHPSLSSLPFLYSVVEEEENAAVTPRATLLWNANGAQVCVADWIDGQGAAEDEKTMKAQCRRVVGKKQTANSFVDCFSIELKARRSDARIRRSGRGRQVVASRTFSLGSRSYSWWSNGGRSAAAGER